MCTYNAQLNMAHQNTYVTKFDTSNSLTLTDCTYLDYSVKYCSKHLHNSSIAYSPLIGQLMACSYIELWCFKVIKLDVCGSLVLSNSVTYVLLKHRLFFIRVFSIFQIIFFYIYIYMKGLVSFLPEERIQNIL